MSNKILKERRKVPRFPRQDIHKKKKLKGKGWRKPKGRHGRVKRLGNYHGASPKVGYGTPKKYRNLHSSGLEVVEVANPKELDKIDAKKQIIKIQRIGKKKKLKLIEKALDKNIRIKNVRKPKEFIKKYKKPTKKSKNKEESEK